MVNQARDGADAGLTRTLPKHLAYAPLAAELPPEEKRTPSLLAAELKGEARLPAALRRPRIVGLLNMSQYTHNVTSVVPLEEPLFQPSPPEVVFDTFEAEALESVVDSAALRIENAGLERDMDADLHALRPFVLARLWRSVPAHSSTQRPRRAEDGPRGIWVAAVARMQQSS